MTAEAWAIEEVRTKLTLASDQGETMGIGELREEVGIGHDDLMSVLDSLRESGDAVEHTPGEWRTPYDDEREDTGSDEAGEAAARAALDRRDGRAEEDEKPGARAAPAPQTGTLEGGGGVVLTMAVASALDAETIGKLVEAGITEAKADDRAFVLRVEP
jgi:hypothetical protein